MNLKLNEWTIKDALTTIFYYITCQMHHLALVECDKFIPILLSSNHISSIVSDEFKYWRAVALGLGGGDIKVALSDLEDLLESSADDKLHIALALHYFLKNNGGQEQSEKRLQYQKELICVDKDSVSNSTLVIASKFHFLVDNICEAQNLLAYVPDLLRMPLYLWILSSHKASKELLPRIDYHYSQNRLESSLAMAKFKRSNNDYTQALEILSTIIVQSPSFIPAHIEKVEVLIASRDWDDAKFILDEILQEDTQNTKLIQLELFLGILSAKGHTSLGSIASRLHETLSANGIEGTASACNQCSRLLTNIKRRKDLVEIALEMSKSACKAKPVRSDCLTQLANTMLLQDNIKGAIACYNESMVHDKNNIQATLGLVKCFLRDLRIQDAKQQIELIDLLHDSKEIPVDFLLLKGKLAVLLAGREKKEDSQGIRETIQDINIYLNKNPLHNMSDYISLDIPTLYELIIDCLQPLLRNIRYCNFLNVYTHTFEYVESIVHEDVIVECCKCFDMAKSSLPFEFDSLILASKIHFMRGMNDAAYDDILKCLEYYPQNPFGHLCAARIYVSRERFKEATMHLDYALSIDFSIQDMLLFKGIKGECLLKMKSSVDESRVLLRDACSLSIDPNHRNYYNWDDIDDLFRCHLLLLVSIDHDSPDFHNIIEHSKNLFPQESDRIKMIQSEIAVMRHDHERALATLADINARSRYFVIAQQMKAEINLVCLQNENGFIQCYKDLVDSNSDSSKYHSLLGNAFAMIDSQEQAIQSYEFAVELNPHDLTTVSKLGDALLLTSKYEQALGHFENVLRNQPNNFDLRKEIIGLYTKLNRPEALLILDDSVQILKGKILNDNRLNQNRIESLLGFANIYKRIGQLDKYESTLIFIKQHHLELVEKLNFHSYDDRILQGKRFVSSICLKLGEHYRDVENIVKSVTLFEEALSFDTENEGAILGLVRYYQDVGQIEECKKYCAMLDCVETQMMLAKIKESETDFNGAINIYDNILSNNTDYFYVTSLIIPLFFRTGKIEQAKLLLEKFDETNLDPHISYSKGLYYRFSGQYLKAIEHFNLCRCHGMLQIKSLRQMIEIYIDIDRAYLWKEQIIDENMYNNLEAAKHLLNELMSLCVPSWDIVVYECYICFRENSKCYQDIVSKLSEILEEDKDYVPAMTALGTAFFIIGDAMKARRTFKGVLSKSYNSDYAIELERSFNLLALSYVNDNKCDQAEEICKQYEKYNLSCARVAYLFGVIKEKQQLFQEASSYFSRAWSLENHSCHRTGYKLVHCLFRGKRFIECIETCDILLSSNPTYDEIRRLFNESILHLRP